MLTPWAIVLAHPNHNMKLTKLSPRNQLRFLSIFMGGIFFICLNSISSIDNVHAQNVLIVALIIGLFIVGLLGSWKIRCPQCNDKIIHQNSSKYVWLNGGTLFSAPCQRCGYDLDKSEKSEI